MNAREAKTVIILNGSNTITAGYAIHEILKRPSISLTARVALPRSLASTSSTSNPPDHSQYLVGAALDDAERKGQDLAIFWPMRKGSIRDWQQMIALWRYLLFQLLPVRRSHNDSHILLALPAPISRATHAYLTRVFFEHFNAPALALVEKPLLGAYGVGTMSACVVDLGWESCDVTPVLDCLIQHNANVKADVGTRHCTLFLAHLLRRDQSIVRALTALLRYKRKNSAAQDEEKDLQDALYALAKQLVDQGHVMDEEAVRSGAAGIVTAGEGAEDDEGNFDIAAALVEGQNKAQEDEEERRRAAIDAANRGEELDEGVLASITGEDGQAGGSTDEKAILINHKGLNLKVGPERFRFLEPLFRPELLKDVRGADKVTIGDEPFGTGPFLDGDVNQDKVSFDAYEVPIGSPDWTMATSLPTAIARSIGLVEELDRQVLLWENLVITGTPAKTKTIQIETISALSEFVASNPTEAAQVLGEPNPSQPRNVRALRVPDYFSEYKDRTDLAPFLGGTIYAKLVFGDPYGKGFITKQNYNESGPHASFSVKT